jgi:hypothetical protein
VIEPARGIEPALDPCLVEQIEHAPGESGLPRRRVMDLVELLRESVEVVIGLL